MAIWLFMCGAVHAEPTPEVCIYADEKGAIKQVNSQGAVPEKYRKTSRCFAAVRQTEMAAPQDIELKGNVRNETSSTSVGTVHLRWPRKVEQLFGRTPQRALVDAAQTVSRALRKGGFPAKLTSLNLDWEIVFLDENLPETQIPAYLISNCHPGWMTPPANIYIVAQRVAAGCGGAKGSDTRTADSDLALVLIHEMGHAVENQLLKEQFGTDRMRAEGFASWFEQYASNMSSVIPKGTAQQRYLALARMNGAANISSFQFTGTAQDYGLASMLFNAVVARRGVPGLMDVYDTMYEFRLDLVSAIKKELNWSSERLADEVKRVMK